MLKKYKWLRPFVILTAMLILFRVFSAEPASEAAVDSSPDSAVSTVLTGDDAGTGKIMLEPAVGTFVVILIIVLIVTVIANYFKLPYTLILVLSGLLVGYFPILKGFSMSHDLVFFLLLPPLLFEGAINLNLEHLKSNIVPIVVYAFLGVAFGSIATGLLVGAGEIFGKINPEFTLLLGLLFGALISATDPVSVLGIFKHVRAPRRLATILEGESLLNDGVAVVFFAIILKLVEPGGDSISVADGIVQFGMMVAGGILLGLASGFVASWFTKQIDDHLIEITLSTIVAFGTYLLAEHLHLSGVIAVVTAGLVVGNYGFVVGMTPTTRISLLSFWDYIGFLVNALVFLLIGIQVKIHMLWDHRLGVVLAIAAVLISRAAVVYLLAPLIGRLDQPLSGKYKFIIWWGGLRGALSMALALSLPSTLPFREEILAMTFGVAIFSLLVQGLTTGGLLKRLGLQTADASEQAYEELLGRIAVNLAAADRMKELTNEKALLPDMGRSLAGEFTARAQSAEAEIEKLRVKGKEALQRLEQRARLRALNAGKSSLMDLYQQGSISQEVYSMLVREVNKEIDDLKRG
jgi:CPA1 family monovalent cation:H+ antiporter